MPQNHTVERVALSLPAGLLRRIETLRRESGLTRSGLIREALEAFLRAGRRERRVAAYREGRAPRDARKSRRRGRPRRLGVRPWK